MRVLFSPVGSTDPISNYRDGAMLHICRLYRPDKVYLYLSKEMNEYHQLDNRYCSAIRMLEDELNWHCDIEVIVDKDMQEVQIFDAFIGKYEKKLDEIRMTDHPKEIIVNVSSGTPAMKSSLQMLSILKNDITAIQVTTPLRTSNKRHEDKDNYDLALQWEFNEDREKDFENRCMVSEAKYLLDRIKKENIEKYIRVYDYEAGKIMADTLYEKPSQQFMGCLDIAIERRKMNLEYIKGKKKLYGVETWFPVAQDRDMKEFEYILSMQIKLWKRQYIDYVRDITPIFYSLSERVLKKYCQLKFSDIGKESRGSWCISIKRINQLGLAAESRWTDYTIISANVILKIMEQKCTEEKVLKVMQNIRLVEREVRNLAAHEIVGITAEWFKNRTGFTAEQVMEQIVELGIYAGLKLSKQNRKIYDTMNEQLIGWLNV